MSQDVFVRGRETVLAPYADLVKPALTDRFDYEGELGLVVGQGGRYIPAATAIEALAGYVVLNDASARDWQRTATQWTPGKNFDGSMPIGTEVVTTEEVDVSDVAITAVLNGEVMQSARTSQMIVDVPGCVEFFSSFTTLHPGDVIATGTPGGVGFARKPPVWMRSGGCHRNHDPGCRHHPQPHRGRGGRSQRLAVAAGHDGDKLQHALKLTGSHTPIGLRLRAESEGRYRTANPGATRRSAGRSQPSTGA